VLGKGGKERVPLGQHARDAIMDYLASVPPAAREGDAWLFVRVGGRPLSR